MKKISDLDKLDTQTLKYRAALSALLLITGIAMWLFRDLTRQLNNP